LSRAIVTARPVAGRLPLCVQPTNSSGRESDVYVQSAIVVAGAPLVDMDIGASYLAGAVVGEFLPGVVFGSLLAEWLEPYRNLSPFHHSIGYESLRIGPGLGHSAILLVTTLLLVVLGAFAFQRRDLGV
jgi:putative exporter of polyketide antibiotics